MSKGNLKVIGVYSGPIKPYLGEVCAKLEMDFHPYQTGDNRKQLLILLESVVTGSDPEELLLILLNPDHVKLSTALKELSPQTVGDQVWFPASVYYRLSDPELNYFYWKHYPRHDHRYPFIDTSLMLGKSEQIGKLLQQVSSTYYNGQQTPQLQDALQRCYADGLNGCFTWHAAMHPDFKHELLTATRRSAVQKLDRSWRYEFLFAKNEKQVLLGNQLESGLIFPLNVAEESGAFRHLLTGGRPVVLSVAAEPDLSRQVPARLIRKAHWRTLMQLYKINRINKWVKSPERIFRYAPNKSKVLTGGTLNLVNRLENRQPLSFAHYNDGELTFIRDYLNNQHHEKWFGRKQQQYNPVLAKRLYDAMQYQKEGYFVGVPCSTDHPKLRKLADQIVGEYAFKVQAMILHHNLAFMPRILHALKSREVYFFTNEYQDLSFFSDFGLNVDPERVTVVPFRNSYLEYEKYADVQFPEGAVVVLTCGMLAKILTHVWYERHHHLTVLALGSSVDDLIQKKNIQFELYPKDTPLTKNLHKSRSFLFGYKKRCKECFDF